MIPAKAGVRTQEFQLFTTAFNEEQRSYTLNMAGVLMQTYYQVKVEAKGVNECAI